MERQASLIIVQVDNLTGEEVGQAFQACQVKAIRNIQIIPTLTKKGRPGYLILLDIAPEGEKEVSQFLLDQLLVQGYHRLATKHVFKSTKSKGIKLVLIRDKRSLTGRVRVKRSPGKSVFFIESDDLIGLCKSVKEEMDFDITPLELKQRVLSSLRGDFKKSVRISL